MARKICFMVMPFSTKKTGLTPDRGPTEVDFDALWELALEPALNALGYTPVRADQDVGALIIVDMIARLAYSDLVVADISIANANVYYEIGVRHAAKQHGCVLTSADWGQALFDIDQMPRLVYPLRDGSVSGDASQKIKEVLMQGIPALARGGSPVYQAVPGFQEGVSDEMRTESFAADMEALNVVMNRIHAVHREGDRTARREQALRLRAELDDEGNLQDGVRLAVMQMLRDCADWEATIEYIEGMPELLRRRPVVKEQLALAHAKSKTGNPKQAIAALEQLIEDSGPSTERWGLIGGRYKTLYDEQVVAGNDRLAEGYLSQAIEAYENGMMCDLNEYYPTCNLPRLLRIRGDAGDVDKARALSVVVLKACDRAQALNPDDEWIPLTRLGAAFDAEDPDEAARLAKGIIRDFEAVWKKNTTIDDLRRSVDLVRDPHRKRELQKVLIDLESILPDEQQTTVLDEVVTTDSSSATEAVQAVPSAPTEMAPQPAAKAAVSPQPEAVSQPSAAADEPMRVEGKGVVVTIRIEVN